MVVAIAALAYGRTPVELWLAAAAYGAALSVVQASTSVLVLGATPPRRRRDAFAWQFIGQNLALALGGFAGGRLVDLASPTGARPAYLVAALGALLSAAAVAAAGGRQSRTATPPEPAEDAGYRDVLRVPAVRWLLVVTVLLTLACYAQFDSGLPAYALDVLSVRPSTVGTAVAANAVLVAVLTAPVVRLTRSRPAAALLATCGLLWVGVWVVLGLPLLHRSWAPTLVVAGYGLFSLGETMLAPVLSPLAGQLAPPGAAGRTLAAITGAQTLATAVGPGLSGALLGVGLPAGFVLLQLLCCAAAVLVARRLYRAMRDPQPLLGSPVR
jgi:MFS family permease